MNRLRTILTLCAILATPALGFWEYDGTTQVIGGPGSGSGGDGDTVSWSAWADGTVTPIGITSVAASARCQGQVALRLFSSWYAPGGSRWARGTSRVEGANSYHWVEDPNSTRQIGITVHVELTSAVISYSCEALNQFGNSPATCSSQTYMQGAAIAVGLGGLPQGAGFGYANSEGGSNAYNAYGDADVVIDSHPETETMASGQLTIRADIDRSYETTVWSDSFTAVARLLGDVYGQGQITVQGNPHHGGFTVSAGYDIMGNARFDLMGDIYNRE